MKEAKRHFEEAITADANYAEAYVGLADAFFLLGNYHHMPMAEMVEKGKDALAKALKLGDGLAEAHTTLANYMMHEYRFAEAQSEFDRAIAISPSYVLAHHWYSLCLLDAGDLQKALVETRKAEELDPLSPVLALNLAAACAFTGDDAGTRRQIEKLKALDSTGLFIDGAIAWVAEYKGDFEGAAVHMGEAVKRNPGNAQYLASLGFYCAMTGRRDKAAEILRSLEGLPEGTYGKPFHMAMVYAGLDDREEMLRLLGLAFDERSLVFRALRYSRFDPDIREDPRYIALFQRAGIPPETTGEPKRS